MPAPSVIRRRPRRTVAGAAVALLAVGLGGLAGCDASSSDGGVTTAPGGASPTGATGATGDDGTAAPSSPGTTSPGSDPVTTPATSGPATPPPSPGTFAIAVAGGGQVGYPVSGVRCDATTVTGTLTPADGQAPGTVTLVTATGMLTVAGVAPIDGTRLTGAVTGTPGPGAALLWTGDGTGSAASLAVTCP